MITTIESGHGPCWMPPPYVTPLKKWLEKLVHTRFLTWLSPCVWGDADGYGRIRSWLHGTSIGRFLVDKFWGVLGDDVLTLNKYDSHPKTALLKPWHDAFWTASGLSILNYDTDFFELVKSDKVRIHIADITLLSPGKVHLSNDESFETEALLCSTGWKHTAPMKFSPPGLEEEMGLMSLRSSSEEAALIARADREILEKYPRLANRPPKNKKFHALEDTTSRIQNEEKLAAMDLYRFMVPPNAELLAKHDIAFSGYLMTISTSILAQVQALWMAAYLDGDLSPYDPAKTSSAELDKQIAAIKYSAALHNRFGKWRYPGGKEGKIPDFVFDAVPYADMLLHDLGVNSRRKGGFLKEISEPYSAEDYNGIVQEWMNKEKKEL
jgi:hypothetical protein